MPTFRNHVSVPSSKAGSRLDTIYFQPLKMELMHGSETSANYILTLGKYPKEHIQYSHHGQSLKSTTVPCISYLILGCSGPYPFILLHLYLPHFSNFFLKSETEILCVCVHFPVRFSLGLSGLFRLYECWPLSRSHSDTQFSRLTRAQQDGAIFHPGQHP